LSPGLNIFYTAIVFGFILLFGSCTTPKNVVYFQNVQRDTTVTGLIDNNFELKIRKNDLLSISIVSGDFLSPTGSTVIFNAPGGGSSLPISNPGGSGNSPTNGYLVDNNGNIAMYKLGVLHVEGLTREQLKQQLLRDLSPYLKDPVVTIRFLNNKIVMIGEVAKPQVINIPNEQITLLEAIAQSGDLTFTGRRDNILVIRETPTGKQFKRINLSDNSIFHSPFYYLKPDDVVYVEPTEFKIKSTAQNQQIVGYALTGVSILITLLSLLLR
jgi:polysaccharide export outer membrane protein